jgi:hypothetical protein
VELEQRSAKQARERGLVAHERGGCGVGGVRLRKLRCESCEVRLAETEDVVETLKLGCCGWLCVHGVNSCFGPGMHLRQHL